MIKRLLQNQYLDADNLFLISSNLLEKREEIPLLRILICCLFVSSFPCLICWASVSHCRGLPHNRWPKSQSAWQVNQSQVPLQAYVTVTGNKQIDASIFCLSSLFRNISSRISASLNIYLPKAIKFVLLHLIMYVFCLNPGHKTTMCLLVCLDV